MLNRRSDLFSLGGFIWCAVSAFEIMYYGFDCNSVCPALWTFFSKYVKTHLNNPKDHFLYFFLFSIGFLSFLIKRFYLGEGSLCLI